MNEIKAMITDASSNLAVIGFDELVVGIDKEIVFGVRVANNVICRENILTNKTIAYLSAALDGKRAQRSIAARKSQDLIEAGEELLNELKHRTPDAEFVPAKLLEGQASWRVKSKDFDQSYGPEILYPILEKHLKRVRSQGLRATGYFEVKQSDRFESHLDGFELESFDHGMTMTVTIDDRNGATGVAQGSIVELNDGELPDRIGSLFDDAIGIATQNSNSEPLEPGDYEVILSPHAVYQMLAASLWYGMYDCRKVDENRTWLSKCWRELNFPEGLVLSQEVERVLAGSRIGGLNLNSRRFPCGNLKLIEKGKIAGFHTDAFWSAKHDKVETFGPTDAPITILESKGDSIPHYKDLTELIKQSKRAIFVNDFWYLRMVAEMEGVITGMTRDGVFEVRDGKIIRSLKNMRWHENPIKVMERINGITENLCLFGRSQLTNGSFPAAIPALRLSKFHFSSVTRF